MERAVNERSQMMEEVEMQRQQWQFDWWHRSGVVGGVIFHLGASGVSLLRFRVPFFFFFFHPRPPADLSSHLFFSASRCYFVKQPQVLFTLQPPPLPRPHIESHKPPLFSGRLPWQWLSWCWCSILKEVVVEVVVELEEVVPAAAVVEVVLKGWGALRIQPVSGRGRGEAACKSWAACAGRSASRKVAVEEGRWWQWEWRRGGPGIPRTLSSSSSSSRISPPPLPPSPPHCLPKPLWHLRPFIMRSSGGSCAPCTRSITSSRTGRPSVETPCRRYTRGEEAGVSVYVNNYPVVMVNLLMSLHNLLQAFSQHSGDTSQEEHAGKWELWCKCHYGSLADPRVWGSLVG